MVETPQPRKLSRYLLVGSLAVNVLLVGAIVGNVVVGRSYNPRSVNLQLGPLSEALPEESRRAIGQQLRQTVRDMDLPRRDRGRSVTAVIQILETDPFDAEAMTLAIRSEQARMDRVRDAAVTTFVTYVAALPLSEREQIAQVLRDKRAQSKERRSNDDPPPLPPN